jgi:hypothetical protein
MDAYTLVQPPVRAKFEELLATWKETPPAGSTMSPVFPLDVTRKIESALHKAKTVALQLEQRRQREMAASGLFQHRGTPPLNFYTQMGQNGNSVRHLSVSRAYRFQNLNGYSALASPNNQEILLCEIRNLLTTVTQAVFLNPADQAARTQMTALNQLQSILQTSALPYEQIEQVRQQLSILALQQQPKQTATLPIGQQDHGGDLLQSLRAAGLLSAPASTSTSIVFTRPLSINSDSVNLRNSDLELTTASLQKYPPLFCICANVDPVPILSRRFTTQKISNVEPVPVVSPMTTKVESNETPISIGTFASTKNSARISVAVKLELGIHQKRYLSK